MLTFQKLNIIKFIKSYINNKLKQTNKIKPMKEKGGKRA